MSLRNRNPSEPRNADSSSPKTRGKFYGMITGDPPTEVPNSFATLNFNVVDRGEYFNVRSGSKRYTTYKVGYLVTAIDISTDILTTERTHPWLTGSMIYFSGDDLPPPLAIDTAYYCIKTGGNKIKVATTYANAIAGTAINITGVGSGEIWVRYGAINAVCDHVEQKKMVFLFGGTAYVSDKDMRGYSKILNLNGVAPSGVSMAVPYGKYVLLASNTGGIFKVILNDDFYYMYKANLSVPSVLLTGVVEDIGTGKIYGYLYFYSVARISGTGNRDRTSSGALLEIESGTCLNVASEKDYAEVFFATAVGLNLAQDHIVYTLTVPDDVNEATHFPLYRTKNIGEESGGVSASVDGIGNRRDEVVWVADVPVAKAFVVNTSAVVGKAGIVSGNKFVLGDVGSVLKDSAGNTGTITVFVTEDQTSVSAGLATATAVYCAIGGGRVMKASQAGSIVTKSLGNDFVPADVGMTIFVSDGTRRHVSRYIDTSNVEVADDGEFTNLALTIKPVTGNFSRKWNDTIPDMPQADGRVSLQDRIEYGTDLYVPRRFFKPIPNGNIIHIDNGFMIVAVRDGVDYYYSQVADKEYCLGQYRNDVQTRKVKSAIRHIVGFPGRAVVISKSQTGIIGLTSSSNVGRQEIGENVFQLPDLGTVDPERGVIAWRTIVFKNAGLIYALTNDSSWRYFDGTAWSKDDFAMQNGYDAVSKRYLKLIDHTSNVNANYNADGGIKTWLQKWDNVDVESGAEYGLYQFCADGETETIQFDDQDLEDRVSGDPDHQFFTPKD